MDFILAVFLLSADTAHYRCVKWRYKDYVNFSVECLKWEKIDCSKRMHKNICKLGV